MILGIWTPDLSTRNTLALQKKGFNGLYIPIGYFYKEDKNDYEGSQDRAIGAMLACRQYCKIMGYEYFLVDASWGLGTYNNANNFFYKKIVNAFKEFNDVEFYFGEPFVELMENQNIPKEDVYEIIEDRKSLDKRWIVDAPDRQQDLYAFDALSSYSNQSKHWKPYHTFAWIYGSLTYTVLFGSLCYESKKEQLDKLGISKIFLYQGDEDWMTIKFLNGYLQNKFIGTFGD